MDIKLETTHIIKMLPHKYPILLVDTVERWEKGRIVTTKALTANEFIFQGHFPEDPILPGIYMIEIAAQSAALMYILDNVNPPSFEDFNKLLKQQEINLSSKVGYLASVKNVKFQNLARPGHVLKIILQETIAKASLSEISFKMMNQHHVQICQGKMMVTKK